jgi:CubicO group peptidase (beta-lactamase class C family)
MDTTTPDSAAPVGARPAVSRNDVLDAVKDLARMAQGLADVRTVPGLSVEIVHHDELVHLAGYSHREIGHEQARVGEDAVFQLASLSKPLSATVVAALVGDCKLGWDTRIADIDAGFRLHEDYPAEVTVRDLFAHRSGLSSNAGTSA